MPELDPTRLEIAEHLRLEIAEEDVLTPIQARSFVRGLQTTWHVPSIRWNAKESHSQLHDARRLLDAAVIFRKVEGESSTNSLQCYRRAGELLEWLSRAGDTFEAFVPLELLAAAAYQLGGLPAMASALLGQVQPKSPGQRLYAEFLRADFDGVIEAVMSFWKNHLDIIDREASSRLLENDGEDKISWYFTVELVRTIGAIADSLRSGDDHRLERALTKLAALDKMAVRTMGDDASSLIALLYQVAITYKDANIYRMVRALGAANPERLPRLEAFARTQFSRKRGILWTSQQHGLRRLIQESSFALCTPTGSGKTLVANLALVKELLLREEETPAPLALYLVPSRALAGEVEAKLSSELGHDFIITGLYGGTDWGLTDYWLDSDKPTVLIATVEKADALMRHLGLLLIQRMQLLIVDEAHQVVPEDDERTLNTFAEHSNRSIRLEGLVSRLLTYSPDIVRIALTAVAGGAASPVARWIEGRDDAHAVGTRYRSTRQVIGVLETTSGSPGLMRLDLLNARPLFVRGRDEPVYLRLGTPAMPRLPAPMRNSIFRFNELDVLWTALHLIDDKRRILISVAQQPEKTMGWYKSALELDSWQEALNFQPPEDKKNRLRYEETRAVCIDYCGEGSHELALLEQGIATNHGQMPQRLRRLMIGLIERGICPITVATATLTEGVNLPFDIIFLTALKRRTFDSLENTSVEAPMSIAEFRNLAGRAGRPGASNSMEGITLVSIPTRPSSSAAQTISLQRHQIEAIKHDYETLKEGLLADELDLAEVASPLSLLLQSISDRAGNLLGLQGQEFLEWLEKISPQNISEHAGYAETSKECRLADSLDELDGILLSAIEEIERLQAPDRVSAEDALAKLWKRTFSAYAATQEDWLERVILCRGRAIVNEIYPDPDERRRLYQYGYSPCIGRRFEEILPAMRGVLEGEKEYGVATTEERFSAVVELGRLIATDRGYGFRARSTKTDQFLLENWEMVLGWWLLETNAVSPKPQQLRAWQRFVADNIEFRLGVAVGAVVAHTWSEGTVNELIVPSLEKWKETTGLPWFGFWLREMLRWGTLEPFVAFSLSRGLVRTREEALALRTEFITWLTSSYEDLEPDDFIDPQRFLSWERAQHQRVFLTDEDNLVSAVLTGTSGDRGVYRVVPLVRGGTIFWLDAAGYKLAESEVEKSPFRGSFARDDFELQASGRDTVVKRVYGI